MSLEEDLGDGVIRRRDSLWRANARLRAGSAKGPLVQQDCLAGAFGHVPRAEAEKFLSRQT